MKTYDLFVWCGVYVETGQVDMEVQEYDDDLEELADGWEWRKFRLVEVKE